MFEATINDQRNNPISPDGDFDGSPRPTVHLKNRNLSRDVLPDANDQQIDNSAGGDRNKTGSIAPRWQHISRRGRP